MFGEQLLCSFASCTIYPFRARLTLPNKAVAHPPIFAVFRVQCGFSELRSSVHYYRLWWAFVSIPPTVYTDRDWLILRSPNFSAPSTDCNLHRLVNDLQVIRLQNEPHQENGSRIPVCNSKHWFSLKRLFNLDSRFGSAYKEICLLFEVPCLSPKQVNRAGCRQSSGPAGRGGDPLAKAARRLIAAPIGSNNSEVSHHERGKRPEKRGSNCQGKPFGRAKIIVHSATLPARAEIARGRAA